MAHFIKLQQLSYEHEGTSKYTPVLFNLDTVVSIEPSIHGKHSIIMTRWTSTGGLKVKESLDEILELSRCCKKSIITG